MSEMVIYTFGGGEILWKLYNALALLFQSDSPYFTSVVKLTMAVGAIWACIRAILGHNMGVFARSWFLPTFLLINLFFVPKTTVHIVDKVDSAHQYMAVDNVPLGAALVASLASKVSAFLVEALEDALIPVDAVRYSTTGGMFAARLADEARSMRISDPITRENLKNFVSRCYIWPFLYGNVKGLGREARATGDILAFIKAHPHPSNGVYWRDESGQTTFTTCQACVDEATKALKAEVKFSAIRLARSLFPSDTQRDPESPLLSAKLEKYFPNAWETLAGQTQRAHTILAQNLMLNATRESLDDGRESFGHTRLWGNLLSTNAARISEHQSFMEMIRGNIAGTWLPTLQTVLFGLLIILFVLVAPLCFLPRGFEMLGLWCQLILWVQLWPVFSSILYCLGGMFASRAGLSLMAEAGGALNLVSQNALGDAARHAYTWVSGLQLTVPFLSWAVLSRSGYAISNLANSVTQSLDAGASRSASEIVDGNISFDNQNFHNQSVGNVQYGRQDIGPKFDFAQTLDTGSLNKIVNPMTGEATYQERLSALKTSFALEDNVAAELTQASSEAQNVAFSKEAAFGQSLSQVEQKGMSFLEGIASGKMTNENWSREEQEHAARSAQQFIHATRNFQKEQSAGSGTGISAEAGVRSGDSLLGTIGKFMFGLSGGVSGNVSASSHKTNQELEACGVNSQVQKDVGEILQKAHQTGWTATDSADAQKGLEFRDAMDKAKSASEQTQVAYTQAHNFEVAARVAESQGLSVRTDMTDDVLKFVAHRSFGGNQDQAVQLASENPEAFKAAAMPYVQERKAALIQGIAGQRGYLSEGDIQNQFHTWKGREITPRKQELESRYASQPAADVEVVKAKTTAAEKRLQERESKKETSWAVGQDPQTGKERTFEEKIRETVDPIHTHLERGLNVKQEAEAELQKSNVRRMGAQAIEDAAGYLPSRKGKTPQELPQELPPTHTAKQKPGPIA